jgi:hypothetical protein
MRDPYYQKFINDYQNEQPVFNWESMTISRFTERNDMVQRYAWAVTSPEAIDAIVQYSPIVEIGAGTGYWAWLLRRAGADIMCYDKNKRSKCFVDVQEGGPEAVILHPEKTLFLCWPPYIDPMAYSALHNYKGATLIYVGEGYGGCTGSDAFHKLLETDWMIVKEVPIPQWPGIHDQMYVFRRKLHLVK